MDLYPTIFRRKSIRKYKSIPISQDMMNEIESHLQSLRPLYDDIKTELFILSGEEVNQRMMKKAPHYIAVFSEVKDGYLTNMGYMLQQMDLYLSQKGLGTCWQGIPTVNKAVKERTTLKFIILLAFGEADEEIYRSDVSQFRRKSFSQISSNHEAQDIIEAARLAPSATNSQPWFFTGDKSKINVYLVRPGVLKRLVAGKYPPIDVGIALFHLKVAAEHFKLSSRIFKDPEAKTNYENREYIGSLKLD